MRKAKWHAKLGFVKPQRPLVVKLSSVQPNSIIGALDVIIERVYPILVSFKLLYWYYTIQFLILN